MGILSSIVLPATRFLTPGDADHFHRRWVGSKEVRHNHFRSAISFIALRKNFRVALRSRRLVTNYSRTSPS